MAQNTYKNGDKKTYASWEKKPLQDQFYYNGGWYDQKNYDKLYNKSEEGKRIAEEKERARIADLKARGMNPDGSPIRPEWQGITNADGSLQSQYVMKDWNNVNANRDALDQVRQIGLRDAGTNSAWGNQMLQKQQLEQASARDSLAQQSNNNFMQSMSRMAQTGGLGGASRERMMRQSARDQVLGKQALIRQGNLDRTNINIQDETQRQNLLGQIQNMENSQADMQFRNQAQQGAIDEMNLRNRLGQVNDKRSWDMQNYSELLKKYGAEKTAEAQAKAAKGGGGKK